MPKTKKTGGSFPKWETPMNEAKIHKNDPMGSPDTAIPYPKPPNPMGWPSVASSKTPGFKIGTGGPVSRNHRGR